MVPVGRAIVPAHSFSDSRSLNNIPVGTASWTDPTLVKSRRFYPKGCSSSEDRLRFYANKFPLVEVNSSYYALPSVANSQLWAERTPPDFTFNVKAFRLFTGHQTGLQVLPPPVRAHLPASLSARKSIRYADMPQDLLDALWQYFIEASSPCNAAGKLGSCTFQFAPWLTFTRHRLTTSPRCRQRMAHFALSVEFRHQTWFDDAHRDRTLAFEREHDLVHTVVDAPQGFTNTIAAHWDIANPALALVRLHGRNAATWNIKSDVASDRFNYDYSDSELTQLAESIRDLAHRAGRVHVLFTNKRRSGRAQRGNTGQLLRGG